MSIEVKLAKIAISLYSETRLIFNQHERQGISMLQTIVDLLKVGQCRETFFSLISTIYPTLDWRYKLIEKAYDDADGAFKEKYRDSGELYFEHLRGVAMILIAWLYVTDYRVIVAALLHDIVEDCPRWPISRLIKEYGDEISALVEWMTKPDVTLCGGSREEVERVYYNRFEYAPRDFFPHQNGRQAPQPYHAVGRIPGRKTRSKSSPDTHLLSTLGSQASHSES